MQIFIDMWKNPKHASQVWPLSFKGISWALMKKLSELDPERLKQISFKKPKIFHYENKEINALSCEKSAKHSGLI